MVSVYLEAFFLFENTLAKKKKQQQKRWYFYSAEDSVRKKVCRLSILPAVCVFTFLYLLPFKLIRFHDGYGYPHGLSPPEKFGYFSFDAPNPQRNAFKVARALLSSKPVMFEGSQGAGKSSLIVAIAKATRKELVRLNLSKQTDLCDLFESD